MVPLLEWMIITSDKSLISGNEPLVIKFCYNMKNTWEPCCVVPSRED